MRTIVVFTEEPSAKAMLESLFPRLLPSGWFLRCIAFEGKQDLEKQLPIKLRGWLAPDTLFVVLRDQDNGNCHVIKKKLQAICSTANKPSTLVRIACRELESWYFGDLAAVEAGLKIYGLAKYERKAKYRIPDDIQNPANELGKITKYRYYKVSGSREIGKHLSLKTSNSASFRNFVNGVCKLLGC